MFKYLPYGWVVTSIILLCDPGLHIIRLLPVRLNLNHYIDSVIFCYTHWLSVVHLDYYLHS